MSRTLVGCTGDLQFLADLSGDGNAHRDDEPYRRALIGIYARLAGTLRELTGTEALRHAVTPGMPYARPRANSSRTSASSPIRLRRNHGAAMIGTRLGPLIRAVEVFGFHLATTDLRQNSDRHEAVLAELLAIARIEPDYAALPRGAKQQLLLSLLQDPRALRVRTASLFSRARPGRTRHLRDRARAARTPSGRRRHPPLHHQPHRDASATCWKCSCCRRSAG